MMMLAKVPADTRPLEAGFVGHREPMNDLAAWLQVEFSAVSILLQLGPRRHRTRRRRRSVRLKLWQIDYSRRDDIDDWAPKGASSHPSSTAHRHRDMYHARDPPWPAR